MTYNNSYSGYSYSDSHEQSVQSYNTGYQPRSNQFGHNRQTSNSTLAQSYTYQQSTYGTDQTQQQYGQNYYGDSRDSDQRAAETLSRMGPTSTAPSTSVTAHNSVQPTNSYNYGSNSATQYSPTLQNQTYTHPTQSSYATANTQQARPNSVNPVRSTAAVTRSPIVEPSQQPTTNVNTAQYGHPQKVQKSESSVQVRPSHQPQRMANNQRTQEAPVSQTQTQGFVDPSAVYDPWPEYHRKLVAAQTAKEEENRRAAQREAEEKRLREESAAQEAAEKARGKEEEKQRKKEEAARKRAEKKANADLNAPQKKRNPKGTAEASSATDLAGGLDSAQLTAMAGNATAGSDAEGQIRQLMAMVKQMNDKHPDLLAKIWEEERQQHLEKSNETPVTMAGGASGTPKTKKMAPKDPAAAADIAATSAPAPVVATGSKAQGKSKASPPSTSGSATAASPTTAQPKPEAAKKPGPHWLPEKKDQIAITTVRWLNALPSSRDFPKVTTSQIANMLDRNPTYIELCEMIEKLGFKVDRASFARALLQRVPDVNKANTAPAIPRPPSTDPSNTPTSVTATAALNNHINSSDLTASSPRQSRPPDMSFTSYTSPYFDGQGRELPTDQPPQITTPAEKKKKKGKAAEKKDDSVEANTPSETPGPVLKAEQARKRTFADLVDLTALSDDDLPPAKQSYFGPLAVTQPGQAYSTELDFLPNFSSSNIIDPHLTRLAPPPQPQPGPTYGQPYRPEPPQSFERQQMNSLAQKLNAYELSKQIERKNALRRSGYDIRTLARDVLLATGKHPDLLPLNGHLENLRTMFPNSITFNSDLSTLEWQILDPGDPTPEALASVVKDDADSVIDDADDESEEEVRHFAVRAPSRTQSISIGVGAGGTYGSGDSFAQMQELPSNMDAWAQIKLTPSRSRGRPRGRPPGFARFSPGSSQTPIGNHRPAGPPSSASPASGGIGYSSFSRELRPDGTKRRGRPVGWRKAIHQRGVGVEAGGDGYTPASQRKATAPAPPPPATEPKFPVFACKWEGCGAELHNLQTLRKHVNKKHGVPDKNGRISCKWHDCGRDLQNIDPNTGAVRHSQQRFDFPDAAELMTHAEHRHIRPVGWEMGDGPPGGFSDYHASDAEAYLSDRQGRRVTPTIPAAAPSASATSSAQRTPGQRGRPPKKSDEEKARESQAQLAMKKREIGLGVDRGGATLANEKRRQGFVDDEDGEEVMVDASD